MIYKKVLLTTALLLCAFNANLKASESKTSDYNNTTWEPNQITAAKIAADALVDATKIMAEQRIEVAKIKAEAEIKASENYGLESARKWAPIIGAAISIFAAIQLRSFLSK